MKILLIPLSSQVRKPLYFELHQTIGIQVVLRIPFDLVIKWKWR